MTSQPQDTAPETGEIHSQEGPEPNDYGFAGGASAPQPVDEPREPAEAENAAVPAGDLTGGLTRALEEIGQDPDEGAPTAPR